MAVETLISVEEFLKMVLRFRRGIPSRLLSSTWKNLRFQNLRSKTRETRYRIPDVCVRTTSIPKDEISRMWKEGDIGDLAGFEFFESNSLYSHTAGTWAATNSVNGAGQRPARTSLPAKFICPGQR